MSLPADVQREIDDADQHLLARQYYDALAGYNTAISTLSLALATGPSDPAALKAVSFILPMRMGDCNTALGRWSFAQTNYSTAARYTGALDPAKEVVPLWSGFAGLFVAWADSLYLIEQPDAAKPLYAKVVGADGSVPATSELYTSTALAPAVASAKSVIAQLAAIVAPKPTLPAGVDPRLVATIVDASTKLAQIAAGMHFYGFSPQSVPVWTFDYLQQVALQYCQSAVALEQNVLNFWDRADQAQLTMLQVQQHVEDANAGVVAAQGQLDTAQAEVSVYQAGLDVATQRVHDAQASADGYRRQQSQSILYSAVAAQVAGGNTADPNALNALADKIIYGIGPAPAGAGSRGDLSAAEQLAASRLSQEYEIASLDRTVREMQAVSAQAQDELNVAHLRVGVAQGQVALAQLRVQEAQAEQQALASANFTATDWKAAGDRLYTLYRGYLDAALRTARLMQQAYNFENDASVAVIRNDYTSSEVRGLLAADVLTADVNSFTDLILTTRRGKTQPITHTVSLARRESYLFETQFRTTGTIEFETTVDDFDLAYPGTYAGRIRHVEVTLQGLTPTSGLSGTLTNAGVSFYRTPTDVWTNDASSRLRRRIQPSETLVLSDYSRSADPTLAVGDGRQPGIFGGAGVIGTWRLDLPPAVNDLDYNLVTDILVTFTYEARFDYQLAGRVTEALASLPGAHHTQLGLPLRWLYPEAFFDIVNGRVATLHLGPADLPLNHTQATLTEFAVLVTTDPGHDPAGITMTVGFPGAGAATSAATDAQGLASADTPGSPWADKLRRHLLGDWSIALAMPGPHPALPAAAPVDTASADPAPPAPGPAPVANVTLLLGYTYTPRSTP
ncbi:hypothetical protein ACFYNZ_33895 [Streptomyces kebangsaanensis]|uniref:Tc toxin complex TcA C-terminal TcB-binding domain-containing protein n=1 Tax=Streptomyces kebangsaanensis TaxID=864058 RepID=A0ABW6L5B8_9ACTN